MGLLLLYFDCELAVLELLVLVVGGEVGDLSLEVAVGLLELGDFG